MKKKIYLVCTHPRDQLKLGGIYIFDSTVQHDQWLCHIVDLNGQYCIKTELFKSRFKKFTDIEQAKFMSIKLKLGAMIPNTTLAKMQTCDHKAETCIC